MTLALASPGSPTFAPDFEALIERSPNPYVVLDPALTIVWMNSAYLQVTSRRREDLLGRLLFEAFPSDPVSESFRLLDQSLRRVLETGEADELALVRYDIARPDGTMDVRYWSAIHTPLPDTEGRVALILQHTVDVTELEGLRRMRDQMGLVERAQAVQARNLDLTEETARLRSLFEQAPGFIALLSGPEHRFVLVNEAYRTLVGKRELVGKPLAEALPEIVEQGFLDLLATVHSTAQPYVGRRARVLLDNGRLGATGDPYYLDFIYQPIIGDGGEVTGVFVQGHDVTEQVTAEERQKLLINELNHRVKNTLSIVQGLAMQSFRQVEGSLEAQRTFESRLNGLAAAHSLLTEAEWENALLADIVRAAAEATAGLDLARFDMSGPDVTLPPQTAVSLSMMIHELCTNALKYGALSAPEGRVRVTWEVTESRADEHELTLRWIESGGPRVVVPNRRGFGTRLIERGLSTQLRGAVTIEFDPAGLRCTVNARLSPEMP